MFSLMYYSFINIKDNLCFVSPIQNVSFWISVWNTTWKTVIKQTAGRKFEDFWWVI